jgi:ADP-ribose pyrophosphatase YjhB (NUDIX family)
VGVLEGWRVCPRCTHELERRERGHLGCPACGSQYYANSAPAVQGLLERDGRVLLAKRAIEPRLGMWDIPGGFLEEGEEALDGLRRELREETGLDIEPVEWLGAYLDPYDDHWVLGLSWLVRGDGEPQAADDVAELAWFGPDELPGEMAFASQNEVLRLWAGRRRDEHA